MKEPKNILITGAVVLALALIGSVMNSRPSVLQAAGGPTVTIDSSQLPLHVTGSTTVSGTVAIASGASVLVGNTVGNPVRVRSVNDGIQPFQYTGTCQSFGVGSLGCSATPSLVVPSGKRLVIEFVAVEACLQAGQSATAHLETTVNGVFVSYALPLSLPAPGPGTGIIGCNNTPLPLSSRTTSSQQLRVYADPLTTVNLTAARNTDPGNGNFSFGLSGYLIDVPFAP